jgi:hypothetical protein
VAKSSKGRSLVLPPKTTEVEQGGFFGACSPPPHLGFGFRLRHSYDDVVFSWHCSVQILGRRTRGRVPWLSLGSCGFRFFTSVKRQTPLGPPDRMSDGSSSHFALGGPPALLLHAVRASTQAPIRSGRVPEFPWVLLFQSFSLGLGRLSYFPQPYFRVCALVAVFPSTETSLESFCPCGRERTRQPNFLGGLYGARPDPGHPYLVSGVVAVAPFDGPAGAAPAVPNHPCPQTGIPADVMSTMRSSRFILGGTSVTYADVLSCWRRFSLVVAHRPRGRRHLDQARFPTGPPQVLFLSPRQPNRAEVGDL